MRKSLIITLAAIILMLVIVGSANAEGGDDFTLAENDRTMLNTLTDIQSLPSLPPGSVNPATGSPYTSVEEYSGINQARMAGGFGIPALNALSVLTIGGPAIYEAYQLGDFFRSKIRGDTGATISGSNAPQWLPYCAAGAGINGSNCANTSTSFSAGNFGGFGSPATGNIGTGSTFAPSINYWILTEGPGSFKTWCVTAGANCTGLNAQNNATSMANMASIVSNNASLTNLSLNTTAGSTDCKAVGACEIVWRTFDQMQKATRQDSCNAACVAAANHSGSYSCSATTGCNTYNLQGAEVACGGFLGTTVGTPEQEACRAALNYKVKPSCDTDGTNCTGQATAGGTVVIPGTITVAPFAPFTIPTPSPSETYHDYLDRLRSLGWVGTATVGTVITDSVLTGADGVVSVEDTTSSLGPDALPWPDNPFTVPAKDDALTIQVNSGAAPEVAPAAGDCLTCAIDWTPIEGLDVGTKFPFGVPAWVSSFFGGVTFADSCPTLSIGKPSALGGGSIDIPFCSAEWESTYRPIVFPILEALMTLAAITFLGVKIFGMGGGDNG